MTIREQTIVTHTLTGRRGVTVPDLPGMLSCSGPGETMVVYDNSTVAEGTLESELVIIGAENAVANLNKCGAGRGYECCIFLTVGAEGVLCERHSALRWALIFKADIMSAKRQPAEPFPLCQKFPEK